MSDPASSAPFPYYTLVGPAPTAPLLLPLPGHDKINAPDLYRPSAALQHACNVALLLGQPLLLTGEPGTGKTQLARSLAYRLGLGPPEVFETSSTSMATDLFYKHDALRQFRAVDSSSAFPYLAFGPLGRAILRTQTSEAIRNHDLNRKNQALQEASFWTDQFWLERFSSSGKAARSVVLIDEVDKAPRDLPNDILNQIEHHYFRVPELHGLVVEACKTALPIIIFTSNSEKNLPEAFLRRCIYFDIEFPGDDELWCILESKLDISRADFFATVALKFFHELRSDAIGLDKKPSTAELLGWLLAMQRVAAHEAGLNQSHPRPDFVRHAPRTLSALVKSRQDQATALRLFKQKYSFQGASPTTAA